MKVQTPVRAEEIRQAARHVLFVEGSKDDAFDPTVISGLLPMIPVRALGPSTNIRAAAQAMHAQHPDYYFLVDRDFHDDGTVERTWLRFPDPAHSNILIWRRRELENYFVAPEYLIKSQYVTCDLDLLRDGIRHCCQRRLYLEAANAVLIEIRETAKQRWIEVFSNPDELPTREEGLRQLRSRPELEAWTRRTAGLVDAQALSQAYAQALETLSGGNEELEFGRGLWLERMSGKKILATVVSSCCRVSSLQGEIMQGRDAAKIVAKDLLRLPSNEQPEDFRLLRGMVETIVKG